jgi:hypothetical protein
VIGRKNRKFKDRGFPPVRIPGILLQLKQPSGKPWGFVQSAGKAEKAPNQGR